ncbi:glycosyltransferase, partial [bacterium]|nr:glycosyltransferase [bacterium]
MTVVEEALDYRSVLTLYASADVLVSLHRSEGLGLNMMEAMTLGTPVIATGWSGNMDFTTDENACLVGYDFVGLGADELNYALAEVGGDARWADPRVEEAAACMRQLADDRELRERLA